MQVDALITLDEGCTATLVMVQRTEQGSLLVQVQCKLEWVSKGDTGLLVILSAWRSMMIVMMIMQHRPQQSLMLSV